MQNQCAECLAFFRKQKCTNCQKTFLACDCTDLCEKCEAQIYDEMPGEDDLDREDLGDTEQFEE